MSRIVVDPITRIEGHLRIEAQVENGVVADAWSSATMWRGLEQILLGRDPRDAWYFAQRICGVCTTVHALASVRAVEDALGITPPRNARLLRDLIAATQYVHDHVVHFYHLHALDWVDVTSALKADPRKAAAVAQSISDYPLSTAGHFTAVQQRLAAFVKGGRLGPFASGYWGHPAYRLSPEVNLIATSHYLDALDFQREYVKIHAILGGKNPHPQSYVVGGMTTPLDPSSPNALGDDALMQIRGLLQQGLDFVRQAYLPDLLAIAGAYPEWTTIGGGLTSFLSFGDFNAGPQPHHGPITDGVLPSGLVRDGNLAAVEKIDATKITEEATHAWFTYSAGDATALSPFDGESTASYTGPKPPYEHLDVEAKYSWLKSPRYDGLPVEVGPLARVAIAYGRKDERFTPLVDSSLKTLGVGPQALFSTLGRTLARGLETVVLAEHAVTLLDALRDNIGTGDLRIADSELFDPSTWPRSARGVGFHEAPRGGLSHWIVIGDEKIENYQAVVPTTWNAGPRDAAGHRGAYEAALVGTPLADPKRPLEILRTVHSFDPCMACAAHVLDADGQPVVEVRVQ
ncbi:MAG: nickel-dependent hydrogenase large subunit [Actinobacteria bacterium]|nr:nickel-dependent hydrogenase large subunit [Actinomycetota bacterium]